MEWFDYGLIVFLAMIICYGRDLVIFRDLLVFLGKLFSLCGLYAYTVVFRAFCEPWAMEWFDYGLVVFLIQFQSFWYIASIFLSFVQVLGSKMDPLYLPYPSPSSACRKFRRTEPGPEMFLRPYFGVVWALVLFSFK